MKMLKTPPMFAELKRIGFKVGFLHTVRFSTKQRQKGDKGKKGTTPLSGGVHCRCTNNCHFSRNSKKRCCRCRRGVRCLRWPRVIRARLQRLPWPLPSHSPSTASCALATPQRQAAAAAAAATVAAAPEAVRHPQAMRQPRVRVLGRHPLPSRSKCHLLPFRMGLACPPLALAPPSLLMAFGGSTPPS